MTGRNGPVAGLLALIALANTGTRIMAIAVPWFVLVSTGSATRTGLVAAFELAPYVLAKALGGPVVLPVWAREQGHGVGAIGLLLTGMAAFSMLSSLVASWLGRRLPRRITYFTAFAFAGPPPFIALALDLPLWAVIVVYCAAGLASGLLNPMLGAMLFERIPRPLLGRVGALADALAWSAMPLGGLVAAALIALTGLSGALGLAAGGYALAIVLPALVTRSSFEPPAPAEAGESSELGVRSREPSHRG